MSADRVPTLYEWAGSSEAFERLTEVFYGKVELDPLLEPPFRHMEPGHPKHVATWLGEVFGGPPRYTEEHGGYPQPTHRCRAGGGAKRRPTTPVRDGPRNRPSSAEAPASGCRGGRGRSCRSAGRRRP
jgi:truncated hemoglobin YjbI